MKKIFATILILTGCGFNSISSRPENTVTPLNGPGFYNFTMKSITGEEISFERFKGKKVLVVNVASRCGYTPQYEDLQKLHEQFGDKVTILGFPANNFMGQEPGTNEEIANFCKTNYGVTFQMFEKISVKGNDMAPLYHWLSTKELNGWNDKSPKWNFCKYLINEEGELIKYYTSGVNPMSDEILQAILK